MNEKEQIKGEKGEFFIVNLTQIDDMVAAGAGAEDVMAYMVLARGVNRRGDMRISTHGAASVAKRTGISYTKAEAALEWLSNGYIHKPAAEAKLGKGESKKHHARWILSNGIEVQDVALANGLVDGIGRGVDNQPLMRIYSQVGIGRHGFIADARLDTVMVLLHLYRHHTFTDCGGINPKAGIYREWVTGKKLDYITGYDAEIEVKDIPGTTGALYEIEGGSDQMFIKFAAEALFYVEDQAERHERFWDAFRNLERMGLVYEVTQVWSANPNSQDAKVAKNAELLYTLYIHDRHARESEPYLQREIHNAVFNMGVLDRDYAFQPEFSDEDCFVRTGRFRYIASKKTGGFPIGIYRLRFRPRTQDTGKGIEYERARVAHWARSLMAVQGR